MTAAPNCIWCGEVLRQPDARRCTSCKSWQEQRQCGVCGESIARDASYCNACKSVQADAYDACVVCRASLPRKAGRCNACTSLQDWRRHTSYSSAALALLVAILTTSTSLFLQISRFQNRYSDTSVVVAGATPDNVVITVVNTGLRASVLQRFVLEFKDLPLRSVELRVTPKDRESGRTYVPPGSRVVHLKATEILPLGESKDRIRKMLAAGLGTATLTISIKESNDQASGPWTKVAVTVPARLIGDFILKEIADV
ncbi:MAG: hypothetical protein JWO97_4235 [Acidobacteria bacterium]|nr:hypothetical protein [Acidobacteriota bacterium]